jgi:hypothetical protein
MTEIIRAMRATLNLLIAIGELFVGLVVVIEIFRTNTSRDGAVAQQIDNILYFLDGGTATAMSGKVITGPATFLIMILGFMFFSMMLVFLAPIMLRQERKSANRRGYYNSY